MSVSRTASLFRAAFVAALLAAAVASAGAQARKLVYGLVPDAPPTTFVDGAGRPTGFFVELFSRIMDELGIDYEYRVADFSEIYPALVSGEVDFFTALQKTPERIDLLFFPEKVGFSGWGQLFIANGAEIGSVLDLQHRVIGIVSGDQTGADFRTYIESLSIICRIVEFSDFERLVRAVQSGDVFGGVQSNIFVASEKRVQPTAVVFAPFRSFPALSRKSDFAVEFDEIMHRCGDLVADPDSYYYELQKKWLGGVRMETVAAPIWLVAGFVSFLLIALAFALINRGLTRRLRHANRDLERRVAERTEQLVRAEKMASLGTLAANIAHELNSPLQALRAGTDVLRSSYGADGLCGAHALSPEEMDALSLALRRCAESRGSSFPHSLAARAYVRERLETLGLEADDGAVDLAAEIGLYNVDAESAGILKSASPKLVGALREGAARIDILAAFESSVGQMSSVIVALGLYAHRDDSSAPSVVTLESQIDAVLALNADRFRSGIRVVRNYVPLPAYLCRAEQLQLVWMTVVKNALDAMGGVGILEITGGRDEGGLRVNIADTGHGILPEHRRRVFEPFFTTKAPGTGTGLGLSIAQDILRALGGSISFESVPGRTIFTVRLPPGGIAEERPRG